MTITTAMVRQKLIWAERDLAELRQQRDALLAACAAGCDALVRVLRSEFETRKRPHPENDEPAVALMRAAIAKVEKKP